MAETEIIALLEGFRREAAASGAPTYAAEIIRCVREDMAAEFDRLSGNHNPDDPEGSRRWSDFYAHAAERIRHPERFSGVASEVTADV